MVYIYKIYCKDKDIEDVYIGSTKNIKLRINNHKQSCNNENINSHNQYKYIFIRENGGWSNWTYEIICQCTSEDRYKMERWYVENTANTNLNKCIPNRSKKEKNKEYREKNKEKINEKYDCECGSKLRKVAKARHLKTKKHELFISSTEVVVKT